MCVCVCLSVCLFVYLFVCLFVWSFRIPCQIENWVTQFFVKLSSSRVSFTWHNTAENSFSSGKLVAIATTPSVSVCIGDNVSLQVDIVGASDKARTLWKCGDHVVEASDYYLISGDGRALFIINSLPPHSGNYTAQVDDGEESATASFNVSIEGGYILPYHYWLHSVEVSRN